MNQTVLAKVIKRLVATYGRPNVPEPDALFEEFYKAISGFRESVLDEAVDIVIREHRYQSWPTVGEVVARCNEVASRRAGERELEMRRREVAMAESPGTVDPEAAARVSEILAKAVTKGLNSNNSFSDIQRRCPVGGTINVSAPWGEEVRDRDGKIVPIRKKENLNWQATLDSKSA